MKLEHVNLTVSDLDRSVDFYTALFGWSTRWRGATTDGRPAAHVGNEDVYLSLFEASTPAKAPKDYRSVGFNHFGVVVADLDGLRDRLATLGITAGPIHDYEPGRRSYFFDPDGIEVELVEQ